MTFILVDILEPPIIAILGFLTLCKNLSIFLISLSKLKPATVGKKFEIPTIDEWFLCDAEKASLIK